MRTPTNNITFNPQKTKSRVLSGHVGALKSEQGRALTTGTHGFHDALRDILTSSTSFYEYKQSLLKVIEDWIFDPRINQHLTVLNSTSFISIGAASLGTLKKDGRNWNEFRGRTIQWKEQMKGQVEACAA